MISRWPFQQSIGNAFRAVQAPHAQKLRDLEGDTSMPDSAKRREKLAIEAEMKKNYDDAMRATEGYRVAIMKDWASAQPTASLMAACFDNPSRATEYYQLAQWASPAERIALARLAVAENDPLAAAGLRRATASDPTISVEDRSSIMALCSEVTRAKARAADAELYAWRVKASELEAVGWQADILLNSSRITELANADASMPREDGTTRHLSSKEQRELLELAGVREPEPIAAAA